MIRRCKKKVTDLRSAQLSEGANPNVTFSGLILQALEAYVESAEALGLAPEPAEKAPHGA